MRKIMVSVQHRQSPSGKAMPGCPIKAGAGQPSPASDNRTENKRSIEMAKKKTGTRKRAQSNPALTAAQEITTLAEPKNGKELTAAQQKTLLGKCESIIRVNVEAFYAVGVALQVIQKQRLHKHAGYDTFESYCQAVWDFSRPRAYQLIEAATVVENVYNCRQKAAALPSNEAQTRPLAKLPAEQQGEVWKKVVENAPDGKITAAIVAKAVAEALPA